MRRRYLSDISKRDGLSKLRHFQICFQRPHRRRRSAQQQNDGWFFQHTAEGIYSQTRTHVREYEADDEFVRDESDYRFERARFDFCFRRIVNGYQAAETYFAVDEYGNVYEFFCSPPDRWQTASIP